MVYAVILAGGKGTRMGTDLPKQFLMIKDRPVIVRSVDVFLDSGLVDGIIICVGEDYIEYTKNIVTEFCGNDFSLNVIKGGKCRNETLLNALEFLNAEAKLGNDTVLLTHDAVRPFIDKRIIEDNINAAREFGGCNTVIDCVDTMLFSDDGEFISSVPDRSKLYHAQTPQSFNGKLLYDVYKQMTDDELEFFTDACSVFIKYGKKVRLVNGSVDNIKITYKSDIIKAERILEK